MHESSSEDVKLCPSPGADKSLCSPRKKLPSWAPEERPEELQVGQDQAKPGSELGVLPSRVSLAPEGLQQQGSGQDTKDLEWRQQNPGTVKGQAPKRCQVMFVENWAGRQGMTDPQGREGGLHARLVHCVCSSLCRRDAQHTVCMGHWDIPLVLIVHSKPLRLVSRVACGMSVGA